MSNLETHQREQAAITAAWEEQQRRIELDLFHARQGAIAARAMLDEHRENRAALNARITECLRLLQGYNRIALIIEREREAMK